MSSLWGFTTTGSASSYLDRIDVNTDINDVLATVHGSLPQIPSRYLTPDKSLGLGSLFHVRREIYDEKNDPPLLYYVAVKYMRDDQKLEILRQAQRALLREIRAIMNPKLRGHPHIISAFGYGWTELISDNPSLFLVMEYADSGTLSDLLQATKLQRDITIEERHHLALEVACGLQALHECGIVHGDLKANNVLVFIRSYPLGYTSDDQNIAWVVKIADFGSSISRAEADEHIFRYSGTAVYNAPEIENIATHGFTNTGSFVEYKSADVYSFGLLVWEIMQNGRFYLDCIDINGRVVRQRDRIDFLKSIHEKPDDALLDLALRSLEDIRAETVGTDLPDLWSTISKTLSFCLQKSPAYRKSAAMVYEELRSSIRGDKALIVYALPRMRSGPSKTKKLPGRNVGGYTYLEVAKKLSSKAGPAGQMFHTVVQDAALKTENRLIPFRGLASRNLVDGYNVAPIPFKLQKADLSPRPPRAIQKQMVAVWALQSVRNDDEELRAEALMELSASRLLGFGIEQDLTVSLNLLREARRGSRIARRIFQQVSKALSSDGLSEEGTVVTETYFQGRLIRMRSPIEITSDTFATPQILSHVGAKSINTTSASLLSLIERHCSPDQYPLAASDMNRLEDVWSGFNQYSLSQKDISASLSDACKFGSFETARTLACLCAKYIGPHGDPTPLHWLVMFPRDQAVSMAKLLIQGHEGNQGFSVSTRLLQMLQLRCSGMKRPHSGVCHNLVNSQTTCGVYLPEHCLELVGSPLHWAIRCHNLDLVRVLLEHGANPNLRCKVRSRLPGEPSCIIPLNYNALDIALEYHLFDIATLLFDHAKKHKKPIEIGAALLARTTTTWSRYVIHGASYRLALRRTVEVLIENGWNMGRPDYFDEIPLLVALGNNAEEKYIIEELIQHLDLSMRSARLGDAELATHIATHSESDYPSNAWKMQKALPLIKDLNKVDKYGRNALHYCAFLGNAIVADILLSTGRVDINAKSPSSDKSTPLMYAAKFGKADVVELLLEKGADIDFPNMDEEISPLEHAILNRQYETASVLIRRGASLDFGLLEGLAPRNSVLHAACINGTARPPMVKRLLKDHSRLRTATVINRTQRLDPRNMTLMSPLWQAVFYADLESAEALLQHGADPDLVKPQFDIGTPKESLGDIHVQSTTLTFESHENMATARGLAQHIIKKAARYPLDKGQLQVALEGKSELMRGVAFKSEQDKARDRAQALESGVLATFDSRLEGIQAEKQGQAAVRAFIARVEEIKRLMDEYAPSDRKSHVVSMRLW